MLGMGNLWTPERLELLKSLNDQGANAWIADQINAQTGSTFTRNAVIGKRRRLGLEAPEQFKKRSVKPRKAKVRKFKPRREVQPDLLAAFDIAPAPELEFLDYGIEQLGDDLRACRFPTGTSVPYLFCGQLTKEESSYCPYHHSVCYVKPQKISDDDRERRRLHIKRASRPTVHNVNSQWERFA